VTLSLIVMRLARNPGTEFSEGDDHRGYALTAPLTGDGKLDLAAWKDDPEATHVRRFAPDEDAVVGRLARRQDQWVFDYSEDAEADIDLDAEAVYRLGDHRFAVGEYVTVADEDGRPLTYKVTEVDEVRPDGSVVRK
jgi:hypothetical protein